MVTMIPVRSMDPKHTLSAKALVDAAEAGIIDFDDRNRIGFATPFVAASIFQQRKLQVVCLCGLPCNSASRFVTPYATLGIQADRAVCMVIADRHGLSKGVMSAKPSVLAFVFEEECR